MKERSATLLPRLLKTERNGSSSELLLVIRRWAEFFLRFHKTSPECYQRLQELNLEVGRVARKEKNTGLSSRFLLRCLTGRPPTNNQTLQNFLSGHDFFTTGVTGKCILGEVWQNQIVKYSGERAAALRQAGKLMLALGGEAAELAVRTASGLVLNVGQTQGQWGGKGSPLLQESSRALLNLANWLCEEKGLFESVYPEMKGPSSDLATLTQVLALEAVTPGSRDTLAKPLPLSATGSDQDLVVGRLLRLAVLQEPTLGKAWSRLADWSYSLGQKQMETGRGGKTELTVEEVRAVDRILLGMGERERRAVQAVVASTSLKDSHLAGHEYERWDFMRRELLETGALGDVSDGVVQELVVIWQVWSINFH